MKITNKKYFYILALSMIWVLTLVLSSCAAPSTQPAEDTRIDIENESALDDDMVRAVEEAIIEEDLTDYDNVTASAELKGAIPNFLCTNRDNYLKIEITNTSDFTWRKESTHSVRVGYHYFGQDVEYSEYDKTTRTGLPHDVEPGETVEVTMLIDDIENKGIYILQIDLVLEGKYWFSSQGMEMIQGPVMFDACSS